MPCVDKDGSLKKKNCKNMNSMRPEQLERQKLYSALAYNYKDSIRNTTFKDNIGRERKKGGKILFIGNTVE